MKKPVNRLKRGENLVGWAFVTPTLDSVIFYPKNHRIDNAGRQCLLAV